KKEGGWGEGPEGVALRPYGVKIFARPRFPIPIFFRRRRISYFALRNAPPREKMLCLPRPPVRTQHKQAPYFGKNIKV
ncbi:hypothetical protein KKE25_04030, partial [Patescibacteria group bacterium]|nr:hypothetical protein [Patescibacteria group bacterium]